MGLYDRDYMKAPSARLRPEKPSRRQRFRFWLWRLFHSRHKGRNDRSGRST
jgi:hypothetical protein